MRLLLLRRWRCARGCGRARVGLQCRSGMRHGQGQGDVRKDEGKGDGWVLARLAAYVAGDVGLEGLRRGQDDTVLGCWRDHGYFVDGTQEGRRAICAATDALCLDSLARQGGNRGRRS